MPYITLQLPQPKHVARIHSKRLSKAELYDLAHEVEFNKPDKGESLEVRKHWEWLKKKANYYKKKAHTCPRTALSCTDCNSVGLPFKDGINNNPYTARQQRRNNMRKRRAELGRKGGRKRTVGLKPRYSYKISHLDVVQGCCECSGEALLGFICKKTKKFYCRRCMNRVPLATWTLCHGCEHYKQCREK